MIAGSSNLSFSADGAVWRALLVASLALIAFALARYWQSLSRHTRNTRLLLVALRAVSLVLLACVCAGVRVEYDSQMHARVLIYRERAGTDASERVLDEASKRVSVALKDKNIEAVEQKDAGVSDASLPANAGQPASYLASLFLTDGAMRALDARREVERASAAAGGSTVYVVTELDANESPRVALESITVMNRTARGVPFSVQCVVHARGMRGRASLVTVADDAQVRASAQASWTGDDERQALTLEVVPKSAGWINYSAHVEASGGEDTAMLSRSFTVYAEERRQRVLFFEGEPTWEAKFIRRALEESELFDVDYFAQVSRAAMVGVKEQQSATQSSGEGEPTVKADSKKEDAGGAPPDAKLRAALSSATRLSAYDCIIVGATPDAMLSSSEAARVREWVERRGGGLIVLGGNSFAGSIVAPKGKLAQLLPAELVSSSFRSDSETLARNQPVEAEKPRGGTPLTPTRAGASAALRGYINAGNGKAAANALTGEGLRLGALRAGATVLAVTGQAGEDGTGEAGAPLIAAARNGAGRAIVFAPADSWRIRTSGEEAEKGGAFAALWQGLALWAASGAQPPVEIALSEVSPAAGREATAEIRVLDENYAPLKIEKLSASMQQLQGSSEDATSTSVAASQDSTSASLIAFAPDPNDQSIWRARFTAPQPARFELQIKYTAGGKSGTAEKYFATVAPAAIEAGASGDTLRRTARGTGGELFAASELNALADKLSTLPQNRQTVHRISNTRTWWPLALIIPLLLSCEWLILRMRAKG